METTLTAADPDTSTVIPTVATPEQQANAMYADSPWTWRDRLRFRLMPTRPCRLPEAPATFKDVIESRTVVGLDWLDRLRVLVTGHLMLHQRIVCENEVGATTPASVAYPIWKPGK